MVFILFSLFQKKDNSVKHLIERVLHQGDHQNGEYIAKDMQKNRTFKVAKTFSIRPDGDGDYEIVLSNFDGKMPSNLKSKTDAYFKKLEQQGAIEWYDIEVRNNELSIWMSVEN